MYAAASVCETVEKKPGDDRQRPATPSRWPRPATRSELGPAARLAVAIALIAVLGPSTSGAISKGAVRRDNAGKGEIQTAPDRLPLVAYSVEVIAIGQSGATTILLPEPAAEVVAGNLDAFSVEVEGPRLTIRVVGRDEARMGADLFIAIGDVTYTFELVFDPKAPPRVFEAYEVAGHGAKRQPSVAGAGSRGSRDVAGVMFVDGAALRLPQVLTSMGRLTRIELPTAPVNILLIDSEAFSVDIRGSDIYVSPSPDLGSAKESDRLGRLQVFMNGGAVYDFDLRVGPAGRHHRVVVVRVAFAPERQVLRRRAP